MFRNYPQRKPNRLKNFDYSHSGRYFVTICAYGRTDYFGQIENCIMHLNQCGELVDRCIDKIVEIHPNIRIPCKAVMPDHVHFIVEISEDSMVGAAYHAARPGLPDKNKMLLPKIIQQFKTATMKSAKQLCEEAESQRLREDWVYGDGLHEVQLHLYWQRGYFDRIIRTDEEYYSICKYIEENPMTWKEGEHLGEYAQDNA